MSGDLDNDEICDRLELIGKRTSDFATNVIGLVKFIPEAVGKLRGTIKSQKDTITKKDADIAAKDTDLALKDDELDQFHDAVETLEVEVKDLKANLEEARKQVHNAQSATCYQKRKTMDEMEHKVEAKRVCITQEKLIGKITSLLTTYQTNDAGDALQVTNVTVSDNDSDNNNDTNPIYKLHTFVKNVTYPHSPKSTRRAFTLPRSVINHDIEAGNLLEHINVCGSAFNAHLRRKGYTEARFDASTNVIGVLFNLFSEYWLRLQWAYCSKLLQNKQDPYRFIRVECIFEVWVYNLFEHFYDLETHQAKRLRLGENVTAFTNDEMAEHRFIKPEYSKRFDNDLAQRLDDDMHTSREYAEGLKW